MAKGAASKPLQKKLKGLKTIIHDHSLFFDRLVDLIPARFYVPAPDGEEQPWFHGLSKAAKASAKKESRENIKKARRARYDPEKAVSTIDILKKNIDAEKNSLDVPEEDIPCHDNVSVSERDAEVDDPLPVDSVDRSVTYEELRLRLRRRIEELRGNRNTRTLDRPKDEKRENWKSSRMQSSHGGEAFHEKRKKDESVKDGPDDGNGGSIKKDKFDDLSYGQIKLGGIDDRSKKRKLSKQQELDKAKKLKEAKKDPVIAEKHSWRAAMNRAVGEKVHDNPKILKESIKKEKKRHHHHAEKWKERIEGQSKVREEKQKTRAGNIKERINQKKARRIEKREKKLMRPGFEGRKDGYINK